MSISKVRDEPTIDMKNLARHLEIAADRGPLAFAPPTLREDVAVEQVRKFGDLPTREIDEIMAAAKAEIEALERDAQQVRNIYVEHTQRITDGINRLREGVKLSMETMKTLREQCRTLNGPSAQEPGR